MPDFVYGQKVRDKRDGLEYTVVNLKPCCGQVECEYIGCRMAKPNFTMTKKIKKEFLELL